MRLYAVWCFRPAGKLRAPNRDHPTVERHSMRNDGAALCSRLPERFKRRPERNIRDGDTANPRGTRLGQTLPPDDLPFLIAERPRDLHQRPIPALNKARPPHSSPPRRSW